MKKLLLVLATGSLISCTIENYKQTTDKRLDTTNLVFYNLTEHEVEAKFNLPPEPNTEINNSTILGIDSNHNEIRDDWERAIAFEYYNDPTRRNLHNQLAINSTRMTKAYQNKDVSLYQNLVSKEKEISECAFFYYDENGLGRSKLDNMGENTIERYKYALKRDRAISKEIGSGVHSLSRSEKAEVCPKYKINKLTDKFIMKTIELEYSLPPEPDSEKNNATVLGVDTNNNGIRDDWERAIVFELHDSPVALDLYKQFAMNSTELTKAYESKNEDKLKTLHEERVEIKGCLSNFYEEETLGIKNLKKMEKNTRQRLFHLAERDSQGVRNEAKFSKLSEDEQARICSKLEK